MLKIIGITNFYKDFLIPNSGYYVDFIAFMEEPEKTWNDILAKETQKAPPQPYLFD